MKRIATMSLTLVALVATLGAVSLAETKSDYDHVVTNLFVTSRNE